MYDKVSRQFQHRRHTSRENCYCTYPSIPEFLSRTNSQIGNLLSIALPNQVNIGPSSTRLPEASHHVWHWTIRYDHHRISPSISLTILQIHLDKSIWPEIGISRNWRKDCLFCSVPRQKLGADGCTEPRNADCIHRSGKCFR